MKFQNVHECGSRGPGPRSLRSPCRWSVPGRLLGAARGPSPERGKGRQGLKSVDVGLLLGLTQTPRTGRAQAPRTDGRFGGRPSPLCRSRSPPRSDGSQAWCLWTSSSRFGCPQSTPTSPVLSGRAGTRRSHSTDGETEARGPGLFGNFMPPASGGPILSASDHVAPVAGSAEQSVEVQGRAGLVPQGLSLVCGWPCSPCVLTGSSLHAGLCPDPLFL